jgi:hypothetical protein
MHQTTVYLHITPVSTKFRISVAMNLGGVLQPCDEDRRLILLDLLLLIYLAQIRAPLLHHFILVGLPYLYFHTTLRLHFQ